MFEIYFEEAYWAYDYENKTLTSEDGNDVIHLGDSFNQQFRYLLETNLNQAILALEDYMTVHPSTESEYMDRMEDYI